MSMNTVEGSKATPEELRCLRYLPRDYGVRIQDCVSFWAYARFLLYQILQ